MTIKEVGSKSNQKSKSQFQIAVELLGSNVKYYDTRHDNQFARSLNQKYKTAAHAKLQEVSPNTHQNHTLIFNSDSAPKDKTFLLLDYDDKKKTNSVEELTNAVTEYGLKDTFTIKTPTGAGYHLYYLIPDKYAALFPNKKLQNLLVKGKLSNIELKIATVDSDFTTPLPGNIKDNKTYKLKKAIEPQDAPQSLLDYIEKMALFYKEEAQALKKRNEIHCNSEVDSELNKQAVQMYVAQLLMGDKIEVTNRNNFLFKTFAHIFTYNISVDYALTNLVSKINSHAFLEEPLSEEEAETCVKSAHRYITEAARTNQRSKEEILAPWETDDYGFPTITMNQIEERAKYLTSYSHTMVMQDEEKRNAFFGMVAYTPDVLIVPRIFHKSHFNNELKRALHEPKPNITALANAYRHIRLHFKEFTHDEFDKKFRYKISRRFIIPTRHDIYAFLHDIDYVERSFKSSTSEYYLKDKTIHVGTASAFSIEDQDITETDKTNLTKFLKIFQQQLTDQSYQEEWEFLLDRVAKLIQAPNDLVDNIVILQGYGGIGKTLFFNIISSLLEEDNVQTFSTFSRTLDKHTPVKLLNVIEELSEKDLQGEALDVLKGNTTGESQSENLKYRNIVQRSGRVNYFISTNNEIHSLDVLENRRVTIFKSFDATTGSRLNDTMQWVKRFLIGDELQPLWGLKLFYRFLLKREVTRLDWDYKSPHQQSLIYKHLITNQYMRSLINFIANLGLVGKEEYRYPLTQSDVDTILMDESCDQFVINRNDHLFFFKRYYPEMDTDLAFFVKKNERFISWAKENKIISDFYAESIDPHRKRRSILGGTAYTTNTTITWPIKALLSSLGKHMIDLFGLSEHQRFLKTQDTFSYEEICAFLKEQYPDHEPGKINHVTLTYEEDF